MIVLAGRLCERWKYEAEELPLPPMPILCGPGNAEPVPVVNCLRLQTAMGEETMGAREP